MTYKLYIKVKIKKNIEKVKNWFLELEIVDYFKEYGFWYGIKNVLFPVMSPNTFLKKIINYELRHYNGVDYNYIMNLNKIPKFPIYDKKKESLKSYNGKYWDYTQRMKNIFINIYEGYPEEFQDGWLDRYKFKNVKEYIKFEKYYKRLFPKTKSWTPSKEEIDNNFSWFMLQFGLSYDFDYDEIRKYKNKNNKKWKEKL